MLTQAMVTLTTIQGVDLGFFDWIPLNKHVTAHELAGQLGYDIIKVERWLRFAVAGGYVAESGDGYVLTGKGALLRRGTSLPDLLGLFHMVGYLTRVIGNSRDAFRKGLGLDSITQGRISRDYIPRVSSQFSRSAVVFFHSCGVSTGHTVLDLGCGDGSVLRELVRTCPGVSATGIDINVHTIEMGRNRNMEQGLQDQIDLQIGDVTDLKRFPDSAFDWVYAINVFHYLPVLKRETFLREMIRISRYGVFTNQVITNSITNLSTDVLLSTLFTDFTGFFSEAEADSLIAGIKTRHFRFLPMIQGESRLLVFFTSKNDVPLKRLPGISDDDVAALKGAGIRTAKDVVSSDPEMLKKSTMNVGPIRKAAIRILFP
jgi:SAM-dependent methyltransferase